MKQTLLTILSSLLLTTSAYGDKLLNLDILKFNNKSYVQKQYDINGDNRTDYAELYKLYSIIEKDGKRFYRHSKKPEVYMFDFDGNLLFTENEIYLDANGDGWNGNEINFLKWKELNKGKVNILYEDKRRSITRNDGS